MLGLVRAGRAFLISKLWGCFTGVREPMKLCVILSVHMRTSLGLQFIAFISSQRLRTTGLVQPTHHAEDKTVESVEEKGLVEFP